MSDSLLTRRSSAEPDWDAPYAEQLPRVYNFFRYRAGADDAEDLTSETFEKAWRARHRYRRDLGALHDLAVRDRAQRGDRPLRRTARTSRSRRRRTWRRRDTPGRRRRDRVRSRPARALLLEPCGARARAHRAALRRRADEPGDRQALGPRRANVGTILHRAIADAAAALATEEASNGRSISSTTRGRSRAPEFAARPARAAARASTAHARRTASRATALPPRSPRRSRVGRRAALFSFPAVRARRRRSSTCSACGTSRRQGRRRAPRAAAQRAGRPGRSSASTRGARRSRAPPRRVHDARGRGGRDGLSARCRRGLPRGLARRHDVRARRVARARLRVDTATLRSCSTRSASTTSRSRRASTAQRRRPPAPVATMTYVSDKRRGRSCRRRSPEVSLPAGRRPRALGEIGLRIVGPPADEAQRFAQTIDWHSTLLVPVPAGAGRSARSTCEAQGPAHRVDRPRAKARGGAGTRRARTAPVVRRTSACTRSPARASDMTLSQMANAVQ